MLSCQQFFVEYSPSQDMWRSCAAQSQNLWQLLIQMSNEETRYDVDR
jgi:hypothetical protein